MPLDPQAQKLVDALAGESDYQTTQTVTPSKLKLTISPIAL